MSQIEIVADGTRYCLDLPEADHDYIQKSIASTRRPYEEAMLIALADGIEPGDLVLDIGANCGNHTIYLSCVAGAEVHAFEPDADLCNSIRSSLVLNGVEHLVTVHEVGVGDSDGFGHLVQTAEHNRGAQRLQRVAAGDAGARIVRLDDIEFHKSVRAMKIDVEGMEFEVLNGASGLIERDHPDLYVECQGKQDFERIHSWVSRFGYRYAATFNATPTHHFVWSESSSEYDRVELILRHQVVASYYDQQLTTRLRENLAEANAKYRVASAQIAPLTEQLRLTVASEMQQVERLQQQQRQLQELNRTVEAKDEKVNELQSRLETSARANERLTSNAKAHSAALSEVHTRLGAEQSRLESVERLLGQTNALNLEMETRISEQARQWLEEREALEQQIENVTGQLSHIRRNATLQSSRASAALVQSEETASRLAEAEAALADTVAKLEETTRRLTIEKGMVSRLERSAAASDTEKEGVDSALRDAQDRFERLQDELRETQTQLESAHEKTDSLRISVTYRLGQVIRESVKSPKKLVMLPIELGMLRGDYRQQQGIKKILPLGPATSHPVDEQPSAPTEGRALVNRAAEIRAARLLPGHAETARLQLDGRTKKNVRVAAIMDEFTVQSFAPECDLLELSLESYVQELDDFRPQLVFLESAWRGKDSAWGNKVAQTSREVREIISWGKQNDVPVVLWNKEDPVHYSTFLNTAKLVDHVFTTDIDCIQKYKGDLGHNSVHFLPFACQPALHNPLEIYRRSPGISFAGAYYQRYPARTKDLESFIRDVPQFAPLEIFDRNFGKADPQYMFPDKYQDFIVGTLAGDEIDIAYKGYDYAINLNSVKESQSMFARRVFEIFASNTIVVSNYSRGLQLMFGTIPVVADSGKVVVHELDSARQENAGRKRRLAGLRKVMFEHTYTHRLEHVLGKIGLPHETSGRPVVEVFSLVSNDDELRTMQAAVRRQFGVDVLLNLYSEDLVWLGSDRPSSEWPVRLLSDLQGKSMEECVEAGRHAALMVPEDYYGEHYLLDLALSGRYSSASIAGKMSFFHAGRDGVRVVNAGPVYTATQKLPARSSLVLRPAAMKGNLLEWLRAAKDYEYNQEELLATETFDYCRNGSTLDASVLAAVESGFGDTGFGLDELHSFADQIDAADFKPVLDRCSSGAELAQLFVTTSRPGIATQVNDKGWHFLSTLVDGVHDYLYASKLVALASIATDGKVKFHVEADPGLNLQLAIIFYSSENERIDGIVRGANHNHSLDIPEGTVNVKLGIRVLGPGESTVRRIIWEHKNVKPAFIASRAENLVITNRYPSYDDLYKNAFVHSRALRYIQMGVPTEVFVLDEGARLHFREFEGITVITGSADALATLLHGGNHQAISLHFVNEAMWDIVSKLPGNPKIAVWAHGADIQKWSRRAFLYKTEQEIDAAREISDARLAFWRRLFREAAKDVSVVFVSKWLADTALEDLGIDSGSNRTVVIHNPIDTDKFSYSTKPAKQRLKVLSIRPYASSVYANDLAVEAILLLSKMPEFTKMEFRLVGDGPLFDTVTDPLREFENVILDKRFLSQDQIAEMHRDYGVFLCPSRMDTQGVSRDEAMSSGLVPVTTSVAAIPEFADDSCAEVVEPENAAALAEAVIRIARSAGLFKRKSAAAASRVSVQSAAAIVVPQELGLLGQMNVRRVGL